MKFLEKIIVNYLNHLRPVPFIWRIVGIHQITSSLFYFWKPTDATYDYAVPMPVPSVSSDQDSVFSKSSRGSAKVISIQLCNVSACLVRKQASWFISIDLHANKVYCYPRASFTFLDPPMAKSREKNHFVHRNTKLATDYVILWLIIDLGKWSNYDVVLGMLAELFPTSAASN